MPIPHDTDVRDDRFAHAVLKLKKGDLGKCDSCGDYCLESYLRVQIGSMMKEIHICPECDLPEKWSMEFSERRGRFYFRYFDPRKPGERKDQWSHPNPESPLHRPSLDALSGAPRKRPRE